MVKEKLLLERITLDGVNVNIRDDEAQNALFGAIKKRSTHNANLLISFGSSLVVSKNKHALFHAIESNHHEMVVILIEKGICVNLTDNYGKSALIYAIEAELFETVRFLIHNGADLYLIDDALNMAEDYLDTCNSTLIQEYLQHIVYIDRQEEISCTSQCQCG